jgi:hypothetical protein
MVGHDHKFMEQKFFLASVMEEDINEEMLHAVRLENISLLKWGTGNEIASVSRVSAKQCSHTLPRAAEAGPHLALIAAPEALRHPKSKFLFPFPNLASSRLRTRLASAC